MIRQVNRALLAACGAVLAACSSTGHSAPATVPPLATTTSVEATAPPSTTAPASTTTTTASTVVPGVALSADGPWTRVDGAPGISTPGLFYQLMPKLWVYLPTTEDIPHGITWTFTEKDRPIIEAYLQARLVFFRVTETNPFNLDDPGWAKWYTDSGASYHAVLSERSARGERFDRDVGVILRPVVLGEGRSDTSAIVFDCMLDGGVWRLPNGSLGADSTPGVIRNGLGALLGTTNRVWVVSRIANQVEACQ